MASYDSLAKQITKVNAIVDFGGYEAAKVVELYPKIDEYLKNFCSTYAYAFHDRDVLESGRLKTYHIHFCFNLKKKKRISTIINDLAACCGVTGLAVTVKTMTSFEGSFQYLIHKNDPDKFQYSLDVIHTNLDSDEVDVMMEARSVGLGFAEIKAICIASPSMLDVIERVGIGTYQHYRATIQDIWNFCQVIKREKVYKDGQ